MQHVNIPVLHPCDYDPVDGTPGDREGRRFQSGYRQKVNDEHQTPPRGWQMPHLIYPVQFAHFLAREERIYTTQVTISRVA
ncbi:hypothetical protein BDV34DRAFT_191040, partial [Aspergillus parasiticus]